jgi:uncharacterized protein (DUF2236 family)
MVAAAQRIGIVTEESLGRSLAAVAAESVGETEGIFGPGSMMWRIDREACLFLGAGRALLLQLSHPWIATAVADHSRTLADPIGRFHRTFGIMFAMVFGTRDQAFAAARRLHRRHAAIRGVMLQAAGPFAAGSPYCANDAEALFWVHSTLTETSVLAHELLCPPLSAAERERHYRESKLLARLFGIPEEVMPPRWADFLAYAAAMHGSATLTVTPAARRIAQAVLAGAGSWLRSPGWYRALTAGLLPERLREGFGLPYGEAERRSAERALAAIRRVYPLLPRRLRYVGPYQEAVGRLAGREGPDAGTRLVNRFWIGRPTLG